MNTSPDESERPEEAGQVSEVNRLDEPAEPIVPEDATAGYPESESGHPDEGPAGPNAPARRSRPLPDRKSDDD